MNLGIIPPENDEDSILDEVLYDIVLPSNLTYCDTPGFPVIGGNIIPPSGTFNLIPKSIFSVVPAGITVFSLIA